MRDLRRKSDARAQLLFALRKHASRRGRPYFRAVFGQPLPDPTKPFDSTKEHKVLAAWGLLVLGPSKAAHAFLVRMLKDPRVEVRWEGGRGVDPGVSQRAGQALADLKS